MEMRLASKERGRTARQIEVGVLYGEQSAGGREALEGEEGNEEDTVHKVLQQSENKSKRRSGRE